MEIVQLDPRTAPATDLAGWHHVLCAVMGHDLPDDPQPVLADVVARLQYPSKKARWIQWLTRIDGRPAATCELKLEHAPNDELGNIELAVAPELRRRGIGRALLHEALQRLTAEQRHTVTAEVVAGTAGEPFAEVHGFARALTEQRGILRPGDADAAELDAFVAVPDSYRLERWIGQVPDEWVDSYAGAKTAMGDAPTGDLKWQPPTFDAAKWRDVEDMFNRRGQQMHIVVAAHEASARVAGLTEVMFSRIDPRRADQGDTVVVPEHRGHGLGLAMKADMLRWLRAECPQILEIQTWNAASNVHMLAINDRLGSRRDRAWFEYQGDVATALAACSEVTPAPG